jgi:hypothetical protein
MTSLTRAPPKRLLPQNQLKYAIFTKANLFSMSFPIQSEATIADDEGTEVPVEEVKASITQAVVRLSPLSSRLRVH